MACRPERKAFIELLKHPKTQERNHGHDADRQAGAQLIKPGAKENTNDQAIARCIYCGCHRTPIGKAPRGAFRNMRPDDLLVRALQSVLAQAPGLDPQLIEDVICGCAFPEAEQGLNVARMAVLLAGLPNTVGGVTVNRYCASGITAVAMAADRIRVGQADVMIAAGVESMSIVPMMGHHPSMNMDVFKDENVKMAYGMGLTAEKVAQQWKISARRRMSSAGLASEGHRCAAGGEFNDEMTEVEVV